MSLPRYPEYKNSGVAWLSDVPKHWRGPTKLGELSSLKGRLGWQGLTADEYREEGPYVVSSAHFSEYQIRWEECPRVSHQRYATDTNIQLAIGDILLMKDGAAMGKLAFVDRLPGEACLNSHLLLFRPNNIDGMPAYLPRFAFYFMQTKLFQEHIKINGTGATFLGISQEAIAKYRVVWPSFSEQMRIATFLDRETTKIDGLIAEQEKLIALLAEKRQATISHAVTKGINSEAPMKDSGVAWLGKVPAHWTVKRLKHLGEAIIGLTYAPSQVTTENEGVLVLRSSNVQQGQITLDDNVFVSSNIPERLRTIEGDILICSRNGSRNLIGKNALITSEVVGITFGAFMTVFRSQFNSYLYWVFNSQIFSYQSGTFLTATINQLTTGNLYNFEIPVPPTEEQQALEVFLNAEIARLDELTAEATRGIDLLKERRSALISAAVTGKIDVRHLAKAEAT